MSLIVDRERGNKVANLPFNIKINIIKRIAYNFHDPKYFKLKIPQSVAGSSAVISTTLALMSPFAKWFFFRIGVAEMHLQPLKRLRRLHCCASCLGGLNCWMIEGKGLYAL
jgi:hypothetical protein